MTPVSTNMLAVCTSSLCGTGAHSLATSCTYEPAGDARQAEAHTFKKHATSLLPRPRSHAGSLASSAQQESRPSRSSSHHAAMVPAWQATKQNKKSLQKSAPATKAPKATTPQISAVFKKSGLEAAVPPDAVPPDKPCSEVGELTAVDWHPTESKPTRCTGPPLRAPPRQFHGASAPIQTPCALACKNSAEQAIPTTATAAATKADAPLAVAQSTGNRHPLHIPAHLISQRSRHAPPCGCKHMHAGRRASPLPNARADASATSTGASPIEASARGAIPRLFQRHRRMHARAVRATARNAAQYRSENPSHPPADRVPPAGSHAVRAATAADGQAIARPDSQPASPPTDGCSGRGGGSEAGGARHACDTVSAAEAAAAHASWKALLGPPAASWADLRELSECAAAPGRRSSAVRAQPRARVAAAAEPPRHAGGGDGARWDGTGDDTGGGGAVGGAGAGGAANGRLQGLLARLNERQRAAVLAPARSPLLVAAGPGSGKTSAMIARVAFLMTQVPPHPPAADHILPGHRGAVCARSHGGSGGMPCVRGRQSAQEREACALVFALALASASISASNSPCCCQGSVIRACCCIHQCQCMHSHPLT